MKSTKEVSSKTKEERKLEIKKQKETTNKTQSFTKTVGFVSLGCDKNRVDTESIITTLKGHSCFNFVFDKTQAQIIIVNTCAFLKVARLEAQETIEEMGKLKQQGKLEKLIVAGCLPLLDKKKVLEKFSFVDAVIVPSEYNKIDEIVFSLYNKKPKKADNIPPYRITTTPSHYAYLKIADGCNNRCAYCKIPFIRGNYKSEKLEKLIEEATQLANRGVKEIILVAQDVTRYGCDNQQNLIMLLRKLTQIKNLSWVRLLYCYPNKVSDELIEEIKLNPKIVKYIDIPLQHISNNVLKLMNRRETKQQIESLITKLRCEIPEIKIRSTFMVGFPGETKRDFNELVKFIKKFKLDNVGFFKYSREIGTASYDYPNQVSEEVKDIRLKKIQNVMAKISTKQNKKLKGEVLKVLVDSFEKSHNFYIGRAYFSAPEVDFEVLIKSYKKLTIGSFVDVKICEFNKGFFIGEVVWIYQTE